MKNLFLSALTFIVIVTSAHAETQHFKIDTTHSYITFRVRHFVSKVAGSFEKFEGQIRFDKEDVSNSKAILTIQAGSVDTNHEGRDEHLLSEDFLFTESYPTIEFESVSWLQKDINTFEVFGYLTMLGKKLPVTIDLNLITIEQNKNGKLVSGWEGRGKLDRTDWGMGYGTPALGAEVEFNFQVEAIAE